ncbi:unnamed protein product [Urochloa humidicola]
MGKSGAKKKKPAAAKPAPSSAEPTAAPPSPSTAPAANGAGPHQAVDAGVLRRAHELKEEGNRLFQSRDYAGALRQYELSLHLAPRGHPDRAVFHSNRAACLLQLRPVDHEAVARECSLALQAESRFPRALLRRARALEALGRHELALADALALLALDPNHRDAIDLSHRLRFLRPGAHQPPLPRRPWRLRRCRRTRPFPPRPPVPQETISTGPSYSAFAVQSQRDVEI